MLEVSTRLLENATPEKRTAAEEMAIAMISANLMQDLIPFERAMEIANEHRAARDEDWLREVHAALIALDVLRRRDNLKGID